jgi:hypothetical protein
MGHSTVGMDFLVCFCVVAGFGFLGSNGGDLG